MKKEYNGKYPQPRRVSKIKDSERVEAFHPEDPIKYNSNMNKNWGRKFGAKDLNEVCNKTSDNAKELRKETNKKYKKDPYSFLEKMELNKLRTSLKHNRIIESGAAPALVYNPAEDPEMNRQAWVEAGLEPGTVARFESVKKSGKKFREARGDKSSIIRDYLDEGNPPKFTDFLNYLNFNGIELDVSSPYFSTIVKQHLGKDIDPNKNANSEESIEDLSKDILSNPKEATDLVKEINQLFMGASEDQFSNESTVDDKYQEIYDTTYSVVTGRAPKRYVFVCGNAGIGKSFTIKQAIQAAQAKMTDWSFKFFRGSIGNSPSGIISFFWLNKDRSVVVLDDCDSFLQQSTPEVMNILKAGLDPDNPEISAGSPAVRKAVAKNVGFTESSKNHPYDININLSKLKENKIEIYNKDGILLAEDTLTSKTEINNYRKVLKKLKDSREFSYSDSMKKFLREDISAKVADELDGEYGDEDEGDDVGEGDEATKIEFPEKFMFNSRLVFVSNMKMAQLPDFIQSRFIMVELDLSPQEIMTRIKDVLPYIELPKDSAISQEEWLWCKENTFKYLSAAVEARETTGGFETPSGTIPVVIKTALEFRLFATLAGSWLQVADSMAHKLGGDVETIISDPSARARLEKSIAIPFITKRLLKALKGDTRAKK